MCKSADAIFNSLEAGLQGVQIVLGDVGTVIPVPVVSAITGAVGVALVGVTEVQKLYDTFEQDDTSATIVGDIKAAVATLQANIAGIETAAHIDNSTLQAWVSKIVGLAGTVVTDVIENVLPAAQQAYEEATSTGKVDWASSKAISRNMTAINEEFKAKWDDALGWDNSKKVGVLDSVVPGESKKIHDHFHNATRGRLARVVHSVV